MSALDDITPEYIKQLIECGTQESDSLDYKENLSVEGDKEKREFLKDICAMANTSGGRIIIGVNDDLELVGVENEKFKQDFLDRINNIVRDGLEPRYNGFFHKKIIVDEKTVYVFHMEKSWNAPHRLCSKPHREFYIRRNGSSEMMTTDDIRYSFLQRHMFSHYAQEFVSERVEYVCKNFSRENIILHIIPEMAFKEGYGINIEKYIHDKYCFLDEFPPLFSVRRSRGSDCFINFDGMQTKSFLNNPLGKLSSYTQLFRKGIIEAVESYLLTDASVKEHVDTKNNKYYPYEAVEDEIMKMTKKYISSLAENNTIFPCYIVFTLTGVKNFVIPKDSMGGYASNSFDRDILQTPPAKIMQNKEDEIKNALKACFDLVWNAAGEPETASSL
jgi:hypothetical protein